MLKLTKIKGKHKYPHIRDKRTNDTVNLFHKERHTQEKLEAGIQLTYDINGLYRNRSFQSSQLSCKSYYNGQTTW